MVGWCEKWGHLMTHVMEAFPEPPCQFKGEDIVSTCFNYGCSAGQHHLPIHHPPGLVPLKHLLPCRFPRCLPNPRMATTRHCRKKAVAVWPQADGTSDTSVLCPWWWMVTVFYSAYGSNTLIFGLVMIGLMEMNEQCIYNITVQLAVLRSTRSCNWLYSSQCRV